MKRVVYLWIAFLTLILMSACGSKDEKYDDKVVETADMEFLTDDQSYFYMETKRGGIPVLLVTEGTYRCDELDVGFYCNVYCSEEGAWRVLGQVAGSGTAYPLRYDENGIYAAGGHFIAYYSVDAEKKQLVEKEYAEELFDDNGNVTYIHYMDGEREQVVEDDRYFLAMLEKYGKAEIVNFSAAF